ncbi:L-rhamnose isomerase [Deinococcus psychrotolerans]|uniref:L-rhamnose isomerase n=1 Tax=Deinococcus psychrotolerans TaxID=2489213 RepID=A0A3G8YCS1_9DEIO|nr:L-rhamnose isomerase [Deinococcus psychrotolerans]AZI42713.1 L-rhamnose isomerase [Deinococcus psychrotolerans]
MNADLLSALQAQRIETPSWGYGNSGTRFKTFAAAGAARTIWEKLDDAAEVQRLTGIAPGVAIHIPWDAVDDYGELKKYASERGLTIGAINPNVFQDEEYRLGSVTNPEEAVREQAIAHLLDCVEVMKQTGSRDLSLWFADGTNYAGQDDLRSRKRRMRTGLKRVHDALPSGTRMLVEYKLFEPAFYATDLFDWGASYSHCLAIGDKAQVLVDLGHHAQGVNIEQIVAFLLDEGRLGGFHFNARRYGDDDLIVGTSNPFELFCIYAELVYGANSADDLTKQTAQNVSYMIDQSHNIEPKVEAMLQSVLNCQESYAKALLIDRDLLQEAQSKGDVLAAHRVMMDAFKTDVRPLLTELRAEMGLKSEPIQAHRQSGYQEKVARERGTQTGGGGYPVKEKVRS